MLIGIGLDSLFTSTEEILFNDFICVWGPYCPLLNLFSRMKEVTVADKKVLLVCTGGQYSAVGGQCSHYNAPLIKGSLSSTFSPSVSV